MIEIEDKFAVLFVDDEEKALKYFSKAFERDFPILIANSVAAAKAVLDEQADRIGVLVTDQRMPEGRGVELLKHVRKTYPQITRMLTTAYSDLDDAIEAVNRGEILRYISKPWDVKALKIELQQAMQLFLLRRERDELMREKLSAWLRMQGVNRARDLLTMAAGITVTRNALPAMQAFIEQAPIHGVQSSEIANLDVWRALQEDIIAMLDLAQETIARIPTTNGSNGGVTPRSIAELVKEADAAADQTNALEITVDPQTPEIPVEEPKMKQLFASLLAWISSHIKDKAIQIHVGATGERLTTTIFLPDSDWQETSLLNVSAELLSAYLICYHHGGTLEITPKPNTGLSIVVSLPTSVSEASESRSGPTLSWLENALVRFENWDQLPG